jgi:hypothetical protein
MSPFFLTSGRVGAAFACLFAVGCSTTDPSPTVDSGTDVPVSDVPVDLGRDVPVDVSADAPDVPDARADVVVDVTTDAPADVPADAPADAPDVPVVADAAVQDDAVVDDATSDVPSRPCTTFCVRGRQNCGFDCCIDPLTDARHCGDCGHACDTGLACRDGVCAP